MSAQLREAQEAEEIRIRFESDSNRIRIEQRLSAVRGLMDRASEDKLSLKIPEDFWTRKMAE